MEQAVPAPTLRRLPRYHRLLEDVIDQPCVSCTQIGRLLKLDPTQVRKDLEYTGITGKPRVGYEVNALKQALEDFLHLNKTDEAFLVGIGSLGQALLGYTRFQEYGLQIVAGFDVDVEKVGTDIHGVPVRDLSEMPGLARRMGVRLGVITVPANYAQSVADMMIEGGILAIWNFAPVQLVVPDDIFVHDEHLYVSLAQLSRRLAQHLARRDSLPVLEKTRA